MRVIGISPLDKDSTVSFMEDGRVIFACAEERLSRLKLQDGFPDRALRLAFQTTGWEPRDVDAIAYSFFDGQGEADLIRAAQRKDAARHTSTCTADSLRELRGAAQRPYRVDRSEPIPGFDDERDEFVTPKSWLKQRVYRGVTQAAWLDWRAHRHFLAQWCKAAIADHHLRTKQLLEGLAPYGLEGKLRRFHHHDTHAANAFFGSGFDEALLVTLDGYGSGCCGGIYKGTPAGIELLHRFDFPNSLGQFYEHVTSGLGFRPNRHEGKIVGLAAYGNPEILGPTLRKRFDCSDGDIVIHASMNYFYTRALALRYAKRDVAAAYQRVLEDVGQEVVRYWLEKTGLKNIAVSGGVHANVKLNQRLKEAGAENIFVYPNMGDGGCGTGAALLVFGKDVFGRGPLDNVYFGPDYTDAELRTALDTEGLEYTQHDEIEDEIARLIAESHIVARFNGRMEYGPRALGNRSILYPAQDPTVNQWLNKQLGRTEFMPFAPAALADQGHRLFLNLSGAEKTAEFMTITFDCTEEMKQRCPAAVHVDGTARPQLVSETTNPSFCQILRSYHRRTGIPAIINTSFNMHEEPIVCSPEDAVRAFLQGNLDYLAIGSFLVPHPRLQQATEQRRQHKRPTSTHANL
jgi:carbamoyltransferase